MRFLADDSMLVFHDSRLDAATIGTGAVRDLDRPAASAIRYADPARTPVAFLEEVVDLVRGSETLLQVDLKLMRPISEARARALARALGSIRGQTLIGAQAHWNLPVFAAQGFRVALDPTLHWHYFPGRRGSGLSPSREGLHGLWDDAPLAHIPGVAAALYVRARINDLAGLVPVSEWMVDQETCRHLARLGVALGDELGARGIELAAWTVADRGAEETTPLLQELFGLGVTTVITDSPQGLARYARQLPT